MSDVTIKIARSVDAPTVARLVHALLDELSGGQAQPLDSLTATTAKVLQDPGVVALLAERNAETVGVLILNECMAIYAGGKFGEISELYVTPDARSQGAARDLLDAARQVANDRNWPRLEVGAPDQPRWARTLNFYLNNGFQEVGPRLRLLL
ncbi:MAG: GNAT family N-acetyltransferase [Paracoccaceae bacterium]